MSRLRSLKRQRKKSNGTLLHKKALANKLGCTLSELDKRLEKREKNLKDMGEIKDGE